MAKKWQLTLSRHHRKNPTFDLAALHRIAFDLNETTSRIDDFVAFAASSGSFYSLKQSIMQRVVVNEEKPMQFPHLDKHLNKTKALGTKWDVEMYPPIKKMIMVRESLSFGDFFSM